MNPVTLSKRVIAGAVANWIDHPGFPDYLYVALEGSVGFGEASGGLSAGSVIDAVTDTESGFFGATAAISQLVLNIPDQQELRRFFSYAPGEAGTLKMNPGMRRKLAETYDWVFAENVEGTPIRWE